MLLSIWHKSFYFSENETWTQVTHSEGEKTVRITVRKEEVIIVCFALCFWVFVICLFFKKWGKIRLLENYQYQYHSHPPLSKSRMSLNGNLAPIERFNMEFGAASLPYHQSKMRPRRNSTFVRNPHKCWSGNSLSSDIRMPRKVQSNVWWCPLEDRIFSF